MLLEQWNDVPLHNTAILILQSYIYKILVLLKYFFVIALMLRHKHTLINVPQQ